MKYFYTRLTYDENNVICRSIVERDSDTQEEIEVAKCYTMQEENSIMKQLQEKLDSNIVR